MKGIHLMSPRLLVASERFAGHALAIVVGLVLMVVGLGLSVTMVLLPVGLVIGIAGVLFFVWGLLDRARSES